MLAGACAHSIVDEDSPTRISKFLDNTRKSTAFEACSMRQLQRAPIMVNVGDVTCNASKQSQQDVTQSTLND